MLMVTVEWMEIDMKGLFPDVHRYFGNGYAFSLKNFLKKLGT